MKNKKILNPSMHKRKGFTLIELIVVIAILAILAAIAVPAFLGTLGNAKWNTDSASARVIVSAYQVYVAEGGTLGTTDGVTSQFLKTAGYLDELPKPQYSTTDTNFEIDFDANGAIDVVYGATTDYQFYPKVAKDVKVTR